MDIEKIIESTVNKLELIDSADIPSIDLYMDQVTTFMEKHLKDKKITAIMGMMADKDIDKVLSMMMPYFDKVYTVTPSNPRAMSREELCEKIKKHGTSAVIFEIDENSINELIKSMNEDEVLIVCGSLYLCTDVYNMIVHN